MEQIFPVKGAAAYQPEKLASGKWVIVMYAPEDQDCGSVIDNAPNYEKALKKAQWWQQKENKAVLKAQKSKTNTL